MEPRAPTDNKETPRNNNNNTSKRMVLVDLQPPFRQVDWMKENGLI
jgi:hypothetical protein